MAIESTCVVDRKCLRCHMKPASFFQRVFLAFSYKNIELAKVE